MELAKILVRERQKKKETQQWVADNLHISRQSLSNWENGKNYPDVPTLIMLSNYYDFSLDYIKGDQHFMKQLNNDYELINTKKANKRFGVLLVILTTLVLMISLCLLAISEKYTILAKYLTVCDLLLCILLLHLSVKFTRITYKQYDGNLVAPLWVPRSFGLGVSINPYNKIGNAITIAVLALSDLILIGAITAILFFNYPVTQLLH